MSTRKRKEALQLATPVADSPIAPPSVMGVSGVTTPLGLATPRATSEFSNPLEETNTENEKNKQEHISRAFYNLASAAVGFLFCMLIYYNYRMIEPYMGAVFWAAFSTLCLSRIKDWITESFMEFFANLTTGYSWHVHGALIAMYGIALTTTHLTGISSITTNVCVLVVVVLHFMIGVLDRNSCATITLVVFSLIIIAVPGVYFATRCVQESQDAAVAIADYMNNNEQLKNLYESLKSGELGAQLNETATQWGFQLPDLSYDKLKTYPPEIARYVGEYIHVLFPIVTITIGLGNFVVLFFTYVGMFYYFLLYKDEIWRRMKALSPFSNNEHDQILHSLLTSCWSILISGLGIGIIHGVVTYFTFRMVGFEMVFIFSFLCGFLSMLPIISSWVVWVPACFVLQLQGRTSECVVVAASHLVTTYYLDPLLYSAVPGGNSYFVGLSVVFGVTAFGINGALFGPLLMGITTTMMDIYTQYQKSNKMRMRRSSIIYSPREHRGMSIGMSHTHEF